MQESCTTVSKIVGVIHARILQGSNASILQYYNVCKILALYIVQESYNTVFRKILKHSARFLQE